MTKSRLLISLMVIALAAALIGGATMAWFSDSDEAEPVTMTAGTLLIDLDVSGILTETVDTGNLNPGDEFEWNITVENVGSKKFHWGIYVCWNDIIGQENVDFDQSMRDLLVKKGYGTKGLSEVMDFAVYKYNDEGEVDYSKPIWEGKLPEKGPIGAYMTDLDDEDSAFKPNEKAEFLIVAKLPEGAENEYQGGKMELAFGVMAWQATNGAEAPTLDAVVCPFLAEKYEPKELAFGYQNNKWFMQITLADNDTFGDLTSFKASLYEGDELVATNLARSYLFEDLGTISTVSGTFGYADEYWNVALAPRDNIDADKVVIEFITNDGKKYFAESTFRNDGDQ